MTLKIKSLQRVNPRDLAAPKKYYATAVADGSTDLDELAEMVASQSTVSRADCYAVLTALEDNIVKMLDQSKIVRLGNLGSFQVAVKSEGKETSEEVNASVIKGSRVKFRPGKAFRRMLKTLEFSKIQDQVA